MGTLPEAKSYREQQNEMATEVAASGMPECGDLPDFPAGAPTPAAPPPTPKRRGTAHEKALPPASLKRFPSHPSDVLKQLNELRGDAPCS